MASSHLFSYRFGKYQTFDSIFFASVRFALPYATVLGIMSSVVIFKYFVFRLLIIAVSSKKVIKHRCFDTFRWGLTPTGFVFFESWEKDRRVRSFPISSDLYDYIEKGNIMSVTLRQAYHRFEWIVSYKKMIPQ